MANHEEKCCPRCNKVFECKVGNITECQCNTVTLNYEERVFIEEKYTDCLCADCLRIIQLQYKLYRESLFRF